MARQAAKQPASPERRFLLDVALVLVALLTVAGALVLTGNPFLTNVAAKVTSWVVIEAAAVGWFLAWTAINRHHGVTLGDRVALLRTAWLWFRVAWVANPARVLAFLSAAADDFVRDHGEPPSEPPSEVSRG